MILTLKTIVEHAGFADFIYNLAYKEYDHIIIIWNNGETKVGKTISTGYDSVQFSSVTQSCPTLCDLMYCSTPDFSVHHQLPELTQAHVHWVSDAIQPSHSLSPSSPALNLSQHEGLFKWISSLQEVAKVLFSFSIISPSEYSGFISFRVDWFDLLAVQGTLKSLLQHHKSIKSPTLKSLQIYKYKELF